MEALAALLLMVVIVPVVMRGVSLAGQMGALARDRRLAAMLAEQQLAEVILTEGWRMGDEDGTFDVDEFGQGADRFTWEQEVDDWDLSTTKEITVRVLWQRRGEAFEVALATVIHTEDE